MKITKSQLRQIILEEIDALEVHKLQFAVGAIKAVLEEIINNSIIKCK